MTKPLFATVNPSDLGEYVGYQIYVSPTGRDEERVTIVAVHNAILPGDPVQVELTEYPGYHIDVTGQVKVYAAVEPAKPTPTPDVIDRDGDRWYVLADGRYGYADMSMILTRMELDASRWGPVRDA